MRKYCLALIVYYCLLIGHQAGAQLYKEKRTQHRFAQTYLGLNTQMIPASGQLYWQNEQYTFPSQIVPRFTIGGLHFWGKVDFNMNFPLINQTNDLPGSDGQFSFNPGADLSARYYPWQLLDGKLRPFIGVSINPMALVLGSDDQNKRADSFINSSLLAGFSYARKGWQLNTEVMWLPKNQKDFYTSTSQKRTFDLPQAFFSIGLVRYFDVTLKEEQPKLSGQTKALEEKLQAHGKVNSFSVAIAPSSAFYTRAPAFSGELVSLPRHKGNFFWEFGAGYLFHRANLHAGVSYRNYSSSTESYQLEHIIRREALSLEVFKFLLDYNGFVPFVGISLSAERWGTGLFINDIQQEDTNQTSFFSPGIIFGWDILASPLETWVLRTNLRYYPWQTINDINDTNVRVDQFEFNFIQLVLYPNRMFNIGKAKKNYQSQ